MFYQSLFHFHSSYQFFHFLSFIEVYQILLRFYSSFLRSFSHSYFFLSFSLYPRSLFHFPRFIAIHFFALRSYFSFFLLSLSTFLYCSALYCYQFLLSFFHINFPIFLVLSTSLFAPHFLPLLIFFPFSFFYVAHFRFFFISFFFLRPRFSFPHFPHFINIPFSSFYPLHLSILPTLLISLFSSLHLRSSFPYLPLFIHPHSSLLGRASAGASSSNLELHEVLSASGARDCPLTQAGFISAREHKTQNME